MLGRSATVDFNANVDGYTTSLSQAIAVTNQYSKATDTMLGKVVGLGNTMSNSLIQRTAAMTQVNKVATAQAAAYQQQLSRIESTSKVLGDKTFPALEKATKKLATQFPIGIGQAVDQMQALQESGITHIKTVEKLAGSYTQLGAATNSYGPAIGKQMTALTRSMGNTIEMVDGMGDSLTMLTKKYGGTAEGILTFSKSIAPIAATVGMSQTQVMGLSAAFARLDEDGFAAGNALNKVMLDLNRSVRDGTPELTAYAHAMNKSIEGLRSQFISDPTSVLIDFTEAINKKGPGAIRLLESLGLEGVRTTKAITSLSREGNLGDIINDATGAFGSGAAATGAKTALGGVNDQITKLNENMSQTTAAVGKPFLYALEGILKTSNAVSSATNDLASSTLGQVGGGIGQSALNAGGTVMGLAGSAVSTAMTLSFARRGLQGIGNMYGNYMAGRQAGVATNLVDAQRFNDIPQDYKVDPRAQDTRFGRLGAKNAVAAGMMDPSMLVAGVGGSPWAPVKQALGKTGRATFNLARNSALLAELVASNDIGSTIGYSKLSTEGGAELKKAAVVAKDAFDSGEWKTGMKALGPAMRKMAAEMAESGDSFGTLSRNTKELSRRTAAMYVTTAKELSHTAMASSLGKGLAIGAVVAGGAALYQSHKENDQEYQDTLSKSASDPLTVFNEFAEKAGYATREIGNLGTAASETVRALLGDENPNSGDWKTFTARERAAAEDPTYQRAYEPSGQNAIEDARTMMLSMPGITDQELSRIALDVYNKTRDMGYTDQFKTTVDQERDKYKDADAKTLLRDLTSSVLHERSAWDMFRGKRNPAELERDSSVVASLTAKYMEEQQSLGGDVANVNQNKRFEDLFTEAQKTGKGRDDVADVLAQLTGIDREHLGSSMRTGESWKDLLKEEKEGRNIRFGRDDAPNTDSRFLSLFSGLIMGQDGTAKPKEIKTSEMELASKEMDQTLTKLFKSNIDLTDVLSASNKLEVETQKYLAEISDLSGLDPTKRAMVESEKDIGNFGKATRAGVLFAKEVLAQTGGNTYQGQMALTAQMKNARAEQIPAIQAAMQAISQQQQIQNVTAAPREVLQARMKSAQEWAQFDPGNDPQAAEARNAAIQDGIAAYQDAVSAAKQSLTMIRSTAIQLQQMEKEFAVQRERAHKRHGIQMERAERDFNHSMYVMDRNYRVNRQYMHEDHDRQEELALKQYRINKSRTIAAHDLAEMRAIRDFNTQKRHAQEDFQTSIARAERDYQKARNRSIEDHDRQLKYTIADNAKSMIDPYTRVVHSRVMSTKMLLNNLKEQSKVLAKQMKMVDELKGMGVGQDVIDVLGLADPKNAQQLFKMHADALTNPQLVNELNKTVSQRMDLSKAFTMDVDNEQYRRNEDAFKTSLDRSAEDHRTSLDDAHADMTKNLTRTDEAFKLSLADANADLKTQLKYAHEDLVTSLTVSDEMFAVALARQKAEFDWQKGEAKRQYDIARGQARADFTQEMLYAETDFTTKKGIMLGQLSLALSAVNSSYEDLIKETGKLIAGMPTALKTPLETEFKKVIGGLGGIISEWSKNAPSLVIPIELGPMPEAGGVHGRDGYGSNGSENARSSGSSGYAGGGVTRGTPTNPSGRRSPGAIVNTDMDGSGLLAATDGVGRIGAVFGQRGSSWSWNRDSSGRGMHNGTDIVGVGTGTKIFAPKAGTVVFAGNRNDWAGNQVHLESGGVKFIFAHMSQVAVNTGSVARGTYFGKTGNSGNSFGAHLHISAVKGGTYVNPDRYLAEGAIAKRPLDAKIAEAGYPELVLPLNARGADFLKELISRYVPNDEVKMARVAPYATNVTINNHTYDNRTQFTGPVTVESNDPDDFARKVAAKARRDRLASPNLGRR